MVPVGHTPRGVAVGRDYVWVANSADGTITQIGKKSLSIVQTIGLGEQATDLVESAGSVWVATGIDNTLVQLDARSGGIHGEAAPLVEGPNGERSRGHGRCRGDLGRDREPRS